MEELLFMLATLVMSASVICMFRVSGHDGPITKDDGTARS